jgi:integrase
MGEKRARGEGKRRGRGEGSIEELRSGKFRAVLSVGKGNNGERRKMTATFDTKKEALAWMRERQAEQVRGRLADAGKLTCGDWLDKWLAKRRPDLDPKTYEQYQQHVRLHLRPQVGGTRLADLRSLHVSDLYAALSAGGMSRAMLAKVATTLLAALKDAVRLHLIPSSPAAEIRKPKAPRVGVEVRAWTAAEARRFLEAARADRLHALYELALDAGMRQSELFGLHWPEVDFEKGTVRVVRALVERRGERRLKDVKTDTSRRTVRVGPATLEALRAHRERMRQEGHDTASGPVFVQKAGGWLQSSNVRTRSFLKVVQAAAVKEIRFHDLRHTSATLLLLNGVNVKAVSRRLGHASAKITLDTYASFLPEMDERSADVLTRTYHPEFVPPLSHEGLTEGAGI